MQDLKMRHRIVARYLALGIPLEEVCKNFDYNYHTWMQIVRAPLFKEELNRLTSEIEERILEDSVSDPVLAQMKTNSVEAAKLLKVEMNNHEKEEGATASSRIKAATEILDRTGYNKPEKVEEKPTVLIYLSTDQLDVVRVPKAIEEQPDTIKELANAEA